MKLNKQPLDHVKYVESTPDLIAICLRLSLWLFSLILTPLRNAVKMSHETE